MLPDQIRSTALRVALTLLCAISQSAWSLAAETDARAAAETPNLSWMSGQWRGEMSDSIVEETWSTAGAGAMMGMFRWHDEAQIRLYEFMLIEIADEGPVLRLKHFSPGLKGWEEKDQALVFRLIDAAAQRAVFLLDEPGDPMYLTYERSGDRLTATLRKTIDGEESETVFIYRLE